jgi:hypothetical protein
MPQPRITHRASETGDFSRLRSGPDRLTKWAIGLFLTLVTAVLLGGGGWVFSVIDEKANKGVEAKNEVVLVKAEQVHMKEDLSDLKDGQKVIVEGMQEIVKTLYTLPSERRANPMPVLEEPPE